MLTFPHIDPVALHLASFTVPYLGHISLDIRWYALAYLTGVITGWWLIGYLSRKLNPPTLSKQMYEDIVLYAILGIVLGGRLGYVLFYKPDFYFNHPLEILMVWHGGMAFHGGLTGMAVAMFIFARQFKTHFLAITDLLSVAGPIGLCCGRLANFVNGELYGRVTDSPYGMVFPNGGDLPRYPSQLFEAGLEGVVLFILLLTIALTTRALHKRGMLSGLFLIGYSIARSICELLREPDSFIHFLPSWITMGQLLSLPMLIIGICLVVYSCRCKAKL
jgi:phosphatidylglycerol:prolipoprotein diacylglycerol transferase